MYRICIAQTLLLFPLAVLSVCQEPTASKESEADEYRVWSDESGAYQVKARLIDIDATTATLEKADTKEAIRVPLARLSRKDISHIAKVRRKERMQNDLREELDSISRFYQSILPELKKHAAAPAENETAAQQKARRDSAIQAVNEQIRGRTFSVLVELVDVRLAAVRASELGQSPDAYDTLNLSIRTHNCPVSLPGTVQVRLAKQRNANKLEAGKFVRLDCGVGSVEGNLGEFTMGYPESEITTVCAVLGLELVPDEIAGQLKPAAKAPSDATQDSPPLPGQDG